MRLSVKTRLLGAQRRASCARTLAKPRSKLTRATTGEAGPTRGPGSAAGPRREQPASRAQMNSHANRARLRREEEPREASGASPLRFEAPRRRAWKKFCRAAENSRTAASPRGIRRYFFTSCEEIARRVAAALFLHEMSGNTKNRKYSLLFQKESDSKTKGAGR